MSDPQRPQQEFWAELRRQPAFQAAIVFAGGSWLALQAADIFNLGTDTVRILGMLLVAIFVLLVAYSLFVVLRGGPRRAALTRTRARSIMAVTGLLLVLGTGAWFARPYVVAPVRPGAEVIAVLPFTASGPGVGVLGEGLVDLLSTNLNEVGLIRTINPRTTLHRYNEAAPDGSIDLPGQIGVGRNVGAGSILVGSLVSTGSEVRITAELYSVDTGDVIARAQETGEPNNVLALVDQLSIGLMQDIWRSRSPMPELRVSAITTQSVPAIRAYMRGEQFYRRVQWDSAIAAFGDAVSHDSTFALAHFRLGETYGWTENLGSEAAQRHSDAAARFAERLPARERALIVAHQLHEQGDVAAIDSLERYVTRFPDDVGGAYLLADARSHAAPVIGLNMDTMVAGFQRVYEMDSTFAPNYAHLLELTSLLGDSASYARYLASFEHIVPDGVGVYEAARDIRWKDQSAALAAVGASVRDPEGDQMLIRHLVMAANARAFDVDSDPEFALAVTDSLAAGAPGSEQLRTQVLQARAVTLNSVGRMREAEETVALLRELDEQMALGATLQFIVSDMAPADAFQPEREMLKAAADRPTAAYWLAVQALMHQDTAAAERHIAVIVGDTARRGWIEPEIIDALNGWITAARGDTIGGIRQMEQALLELGYAPAVTGPSTPLRLQLALLQITQAATRRAGIRRLELWSREGGSIAFAAIPLAEAYLAEGRIEDAKSMYARFVDLWKDADAELQPRVQAAVNALSRISGERSST